MKIFIFLITLFASFSVHALEIVQRMDLVNSTKKVRVISGEHIGDELYFQGQPSKSSQIILEINQPKITAPVYALAGEVRYKNIHQTGYLELLNHFSGHKSFFSRGLAKSGLEKKLSGDSEWRKFALRFFRNETGSYENTELPPPERLTLNVMLPQGGELALRDLKLVTLKNVRDWNSLSGHWWGPGQAGLVFGSLGALIGVLGGMLGFLTGKGRAREFGVGMTNVLIIAGTLCFLSSVFSYFKGQPYHVYYPLALVGLLLVFILGFNLKNIRKRYAELELQKIKAQDVI